MPCYCLHLLNNTISITSTRYKLLKNVSVFHFTLSVFFSVSVTHLVHFSLQHFCRFFFMFSNFLFYFQVHGIIQNCIFYVYLNKLNSFLCSEESWEFQKGHCTVNYPGKYCGKNPVRLNKVFFTKIVNKMTKITLNIQNK